MSRTWPNWWFIFVTVFVSFEGNALESLIIDTNVTWIDHPPACYEVGVYEAIIARQEISDCKRYCAKDSKCRSAIYMAPRYCNLSNVISHHTKQTCKNKALLFEKVPTNTTQSKQLSSLKPLTTPGPHFLEHRGRCLRISHNYNSQNVMKYECKLACKAIAECKMAVFTSRKNACYFSSKIELIKKCDGGNVVYEKVKPGDPRDARFVLLKKSGSAYTSVQVFRRVSATMILNIFLHYLPLI